MKNKRLLWYLICNITIFILECIGISLAFANRGTSALRFYTQLSNLFLMITSALNVFAIIGVMTGKIKKIPHFINLLSYCSICTTTVTLVVVLFVLSWMVGDLWWILTSGAMLYTHSLCPTIAILMFRFLAPEKLSKKAAFYAMIPTIAYAIVGISMNFAHIWVGPYPFLQVYDQPVWASIVWIITILGGAYAIARLLLWRKRAKKAH